MIVEFDSNLANGQSVSVVAKVTYSVELKSVVAGERPVPIESLSWDDRTSLEADAAAEDYEEKRRAKESA